MNDIDQVFVKWVFENLGSINDDDVCEWIVENAEPDTWQDLLNILTRELGIHIEKMSMMKAIKNAGIF